MPGSTTGLPTGSGLRPKSPDNRERDKPNNGVEHDPAMPLADPLRLAALAGTAGRRRHDAVQDWPGCAQAVADDFSDRLRLTGKGDFAHFSTTGCSPARRPHAGA